MKKIEQPAFPIDADAYADSDLSGMSLRDYFAAKALIPMVGRRLGDAEVAQCAYALADAMMRERDKLDIPEKQE